MILIVEENHSYNQIIGPAPYMTALAKACGLATRYFALSYPSLPNYIGMTSGVIPSTVAHRDCLPVGTCLAHVSNLFHRVGSWHVFAESMPSPCYRGDTSLYLARHTAAPYYPNITSCKTKMLRLGTLSSGPLSSALATGQLPTFSLVIPNAVDDMHGGCVSCGDTWLAKWIPKMRASPVYRKGRLAIIITFDSDNRSAANHVATIVVSPYTRAGARVSTTFSHYSLLRALCSIFRVPALGHAATNPGGFATGFHL